MKSLRIGVVLLAVVVAAIFIWPMTGIRCHAHPNHLAIVLAAGKKAYVDAYGQLPPSDPQKFLRVLQGEGVDGYNSHKITFVEFSPREFNAGGELMDAWGHPYIWDTRPPEGRLAIWSRGKNQKQDRETARERELYVVLID